MSLETDHDFYKKKQQHKSSCHSPPSFSGGAVAAGGFGQGKGPIHLDQVRCTGKEEFLGECPSLGQSIQGCRRREDAGVRCDVSPQESAVQVKPQELSCGLRKLVKEEGQRRNQGEENLLRYEFELSKSVVLSPMYLISCAQD